MSRKDFFRQSSWMFMATMMSGALMFAVHLLSKFIPTSEYGQFGTMVSLLNCISIPAVGLQMVFAHQAAAAVTEKERERLRCTARGVLMGTFALWLVFVVGGLLMHGFLVESWQLSNPVTLWFILGSGLLALWKPLLGGLLQGKQNFKWLGWSIVIDGAGRLTVAGILVLLFQGYADGMSLAILIGAFASLAVLLKFNSEIWRPVTVRMEWGPWLKRVVPLTLGFGSFQYMMTADPLYVQAWFDKEKTGFYLSAGTLARALIAFTAPIVWVMFPKIVRSVANSEKSDLMWPTIITVGVLAGIGALGLSVVAPIVLPLFFKASFSEAVPLLRWFSWALVPLVVANVLVNNLMAKNQFTVVYYLVAVALIYTGLIFLFHETFIQVIQILGVCNLMYLGVAVLFTRLHRDEEVTEAEAAASTA